jgi:hypothetical protein
MSTNKVIKAIKQIDSQRCSFLESINIQTITKIIINNKLTIK